LPPQPTANPPIGKDDDALIGQFGSSLPGNYRQRVNLTRHPSSQNVCKYSF
jgi:hypothetical protein